MAENQHSARQRQPLSGRNNLATANESSNKSPPLSSRQRSARKAADRDSYKAANDSNAYRSSSNTLRLTGASNTGDDYYNPPILPASRHPTVVLSAERAGKRYVRPLTCPDSWLEKSQNATIFDTSNHSVKVSDAEKAEFFSTFVDRNKDKLWKYNIEYNRKTPRTVYNDLMSKKNFATTAAKLHNAENRLRLSNSDSIAACCRLDVNFRPKDEVKDPYRSSLTTDRATRDERLTRLLTPALATVETRFKRGHEHAPEYGNFSKFNALLKSNASATLKR